jgi:MFS family permease
MVSDVLFKVGFVQAIIFVPALVGLVIGIIALVKISGYRKKHKEPNQAVEGQPEPVDSLAITIPWLNNGFVSGLFMGVTIGSGFCAPYMVVYILRFLSLVSANAATTFNCISFILGIVLAFLFGRMAKKAIIGIGLNTFGFTGNGVGRILLAILGLVVGFITGLVCIAIVLVPFILIKVAASV